MSENKTEHKSGYVAITGKPNVGKSTLLNRILGTRLSAVTHKAQTTRHQILGIYSEENAQVIFWDTPGIINPKYALQKAMMRFTDRARKDADIILFVAEAQEDTTPENAFSELSRFGKPVILVINKIDVCEQQQAENTAIRLNEKFRFSDTVFISAQQGIGIDRLLETIIQHLNPGPPFYPKDDISEHPVRFFAAEFIREQLFLQYHEEIPYSSTVEVINYEERDDLDLIHAEIIVARNSQKGIIIGKGGNAIKKLGAAARQSIEEFIGRKVYLELHVKVRDNWRDKENMVRNLGYT